LKNLKCCFAKIAGISGRIKMINISCGIKIVKNTLSNKLVF